MPAGAGLPPVTTPRSAATQMPPQVPRTITVAAHTRAAPGMSRLAKNTAAATDPGVAAAQANANGLARKQAANGGGGATTTSATVPPYYQEALDRANQDISGKLGTLQQQQTADALAAQQQSATLANYYRALGPLLQQVAPGVQAGYQQAAGMDAILGKAFGGQLDQQDSANAAQAMGILRGTGGTAQMPGLAAATGTPGLGNAVGWLNAGLPAQGLTQAGAAYGAAANLLPGQVAQAGGQQIAQGQQAAAAQQQTDAAKIQALQATVPGLANSLAPGIQRADIAANASLAAMSGIDPTTGQPTPAYLKTLSDIAASKSNIAYKSAVLKLDQFKAANDAAYKNGELTIQQYNANTSRYRAQQVALKDALTQQPKFNAAASKTRGFTADQYGNPILNKAGQMTLLPGFAYGPNNTIIKAPSANSAKLSTSLINDTSKQIQSWKTGQTGTAKGLPVTDPSRQLSYSEALTRAIALGPNTPAWNAKATQLVNSVYGSPQKIALTAATDAKAAGHNLTSAVTVLLQQEASLPINTYVPALARVYGVKPDDVREVISQVQQLQGQSSGQTSGSEATGSAVQAAQGVVGTPYSWGGGGTGGASYGTGQGATTKGFDCSGLLQYCLGKAGVPIARSTYDQYKQGTPVAENQLQPGDAVFFEPTSKGPGHVAIYIGNGQVIAAPHTGSTVQVQSLADVSKWDGYVGARRYGSDGTAAVQHAVSTIGTPAQTPRKGTGG